MPKKTDGSGKPGASPQAKRKSFRMIGKYAFAWRQYNKVRPKIRKTYVCVQNFPHFSWYCNVFSIVPRFTSKGRGCKSLQKWASRGEDRAFCEVRPTAEWRESIGYPAGCNSRNSNSENLSGEVKQSKTLPSCSPVYRVLPKMKNSRCVRGIDAALLYCAA